MNTMTSCSRQSIRIISSRRKRPSEAETEGHGAEQPPSGDPFRQEIRVICLYPTVDAGKLARQWLEAAIRETSPDTSPVIEFFNYTVLNHEAIRWEQVLGRLEPDIILMVDNGNQLLGAGLRNSLRDLFSLGGNGRRPLILFRDLEPQPTINAHILLDYVSALSRRNHCQLNATDGNGTPIGCFRNPRHLLAARRHRE